MNRMQRVEPSDASVVRPSQAPRGHCADDHDQAEPAARRTTAVVNKSTSPLAKSLSGSILLRPLAPDTMNRDAQPRPHEPRTFRSLVGNDAESGVP
jgi:hypothetical protein